MADEVFNREGFAAMPRIAGPNRVYTPRASTRSSIALWWGIAVTIDGDSRGQCNFELEPVSPSEDERCGLTCTLTPAPGFNDITRKMAGLLNDAFRGHAEE